MRSEAVQRASKNCLPRATDKGLTSPATMLIKHEDARGLNAKC